MVESLLDFCSLENRSGTPVPEGLRHGLFRAKKRVLLWIWGTAEQHLAMSQNCHISSGDPQRQFRKHPSGGLPGPTSVRRIAADQERLSLGLEHCELAPNERFVPKVLGCGHVCDDGPYNRDSAYSTTGATSPRSSLLFHLDWTRAVLSRNRASSASVIGCWSSKMRVE